MTGTQPTNETSETMPTESRTWLTRLGDLLCDVLNLLFWG